MDLFGNPEGLFLLLQIYAASLKSESTKKSPYNPQLQSAIDQKLLISLSLCAKPRATGQVRIISLPVWAVWVTVAIGQNRQGSAAGSTVQGWGWVSRDSSSPRNAFSLQAVGH